MRKPILLTLCSMALVTAVYAQRHCKCDVGDIKDWNKKPKGANENITGSKQLFQHPLTTFYRWGKNAGKMNPNQILNRIVNSVTNNLFTQKLQPFKRIFLPLRKNNTKVLVANFLFSLDLEKW